MISTMGFGVIGAGTWRELHAILAAPARQGVLVTVEALWQL
jgi:hypothetical protein